MESLEFMRNLMVPFHYHKFGIKSWGFEYWFENNKMYCGKIIQVRQNEWSSFGAFHYHKIKDETFLVISGTLILDILDLSRVSGKKLISENIIKPKVELMDPWVNRYYLRPFDYLRIRPGVLHRFSSLEKEAVFTETSTTHREEDSYRISSPSPEEQLEYSVEHFHDLRDFPQNTERFSFLQKEKED